MPTKNVLWPLFGMPQLDVRRHHYRVAPNDNWPMIFAAVAPDVALSILLWYSSKKKLVFSETTCQVRFKPFFFCTPYKSCAGSACAWSTQERGPRCKCGPQRCWVSSPENFPEPARRLRFVPRRSPVCLGSS